MTSKVSRGFMGMFSKATPAADASKLKPGVALPHVTLPTTEASARAGSCRRQQVQPPAAAAGERRRAAVRCRVRGADNARFEISPLPLLALL